MFISVLKRVLPFTLTMIIGAALGGFVNLLNWRGSETTPRLMLTAPSNPRTAACRSRSFARRPSSEGATRPVIRFKPEPGYTEAARKNGVAGVVRLDVMFGADGKISSVDAIEPLPYGLTEQAIRAARGIQFDPATVNGVPVATRMNVEYYFNRY